MSVQEALAHCGKGITGIAVGAKDAAWKAGSWLGRTVVAIANTIAEYAVKAYQTATPVFRDTIVPFCVETAKRAGNFLLQNRVGIVVGALLTMALYALFNQYSDKTSVKITA